MPISILIRILIGAVASIALVCAVAGIITKTDIIDKIREFIKSHKYKKTDKETNKETEEDEDVIGVMIREVTKNKKTVKADILNRNNEVVATEVFEGEGVSDDIEEGTIILV